MISKKKGNRKISESVVGKYVKRDNPVELPSKLSFSIHYFQSVVFLFLFFHSSYVINYLLFIFFLSSFYSSCILLRHLNFPVYTCYVCHSVTNVWTNVNRQNVKKKEKSGDVDFDTVDSQPKTLAEKCARAQQLKDFNKLRPNYGPSSSTVSGIMCTTSANNLTNLGKFSFSIIYITIINRFNFSIKFRIMQ